MGKKVIGDAPDVKMIVDDDGVHLRAGTNWYSVTKDGITESGEKTMVAGSDQMKNGVLTKGANDFQRLIPPTITTMQPQRSINVPIMPIISLITLTAGIVGIGLLLKAAQSS